MAYERDEVRDSAVEWIGVVLRHHRDQDNPVLKHTRALLGQPTWWWLYDKPLEVPHWSTGAVDAYRRNGKVVTNVGQHDSLVREHVVPRKVIVDLLLALPQPTPGAIQDIFERSMSWRL